MEILDAQVYSGASFWSPFRGIRLSLREDPKPMEASILVQKLVEHLSSSLPGLRDHYCSRDIVSAQGDGFFEQLPCINIAHVIEHIAMELQRIAGQSVNLGDIHRTRIAPESATAHRGCHSAFIPYQESQVGVAAGRLAMRFIQWIAQPDRHPGFDFAQQLVGLTSLSRELRPGADTRELGLEAERRDIPVERINDNRGPVQLGRGSRPRMSLLQLGQGKYQKRIWAPYISTDSFIGAEIAFNKELTHRLLGHVGLPVPRALSVTDEEAAVVAACTIGYPVVVKPLDSSQGRGVGVHLLDPASVRRQFHRAMHATASGRVLVESFITGRHYRILVIGGRYVAASERIPAHVVGDGSHTLQELVDMTNADPKRHANHRIRLVFDDDAKALAFKQGCAAGDRVPLEKRVYLSLTANISTGGISVDCTDEIHPYNRAIAEQAALVVGLDVAGVDLIAPDIAQSVRETGGAIGEVNCGPGLFVVHSQPDVGQPREVVAPILDLLFPPGVPSRIPIVAVAGSVDPCATSLMIAHALQRAGHRVGTATSEGVYIDALRMVDGDRSDPEAARMVLRNPAIDMAVLEVGYRGLLNSGLGYDRADVAVITSVGGEWAGLPGIECARDLARLNAVVATSTGGRGVVVLNAEDEGCVRIAGEVSGRVIYFSCDAEHPVIESHRRMGGRAIVLREDTQGARHGYLEEKGDSVRIAQIPAAGSAPNEVTRILAALAACSALDVDFKCFRQSVSTSSIAGPK